MAPFLNFVFHGVAANASRTGNGPYFPSGWHGYGEGPNENSIQMVPAEGGGPPLLLVIFRDDDQAGVFQSDACNYTTVRSTDLGKNWGSPTILPAGTVCPATVPLRQGRFFLLSGGRENSAPGQATAGPGCRTAWEAHCSNFDVVLWMAPTSAFLCGTNCSEQWTKYSISYLHNSLLPSTTSDTLRFTAEVNTTRHQSSSYTSLYPLSADSALLTYNLVTPGICSFSLTAGGGCDGKEEISSLWAMKISLTMVDSSNIMSGVNRRQKTDDTNYTCTGHVFVASAWGAVCSCSPVPGGLNPRGQPVVPGATGNLSCATAPVPGIENMVEMFGSDGMTGAASVDCLLHGPNKTAGNRTACQYWDPNYRIKHRRFGTVGQPAGRRVVRIDVVDQLEWRNLWNSSDRPPIWLDGAVAVLRKQSAAFFAKYHAAGGQIDELVFDTELFGPHPRNF